MSWGVLFTDNSPVCMYIVFLSFVIYSYVQFPWRIMCIFYMVSSLLFIMRPIGVIEPDVHAWFTYKVAVIIGMSCAEVVKEETKKSYMYTHIGVILFSFMFAYDKIAGWIVMPMLFVIMSVLSGYKKMTSFATPVLILSSILCSKLPAAPLISICLPVVGLVPFQFVYDVFPEEVIDV